MIDTVTPSVDTAHVLNTSTWMMQ